MLSGGQSVSQTATICSVLFNAKINQKLAFKFFGPYHILELIGSVAYKIALPAHTSIHLVFHVSQLKIFVPCESHATPLSTYIDLLRKPEKIL